MIFGTFPLRFSWADAKFRVGLLAACNLATTNSLSPALA
jgi:hypothetical protein